MKRYLLLTSVLGFATFSAYGYAIAAEKAPSEVKYQKIEDIPEGLRQNLTYASSKEQYIQTVLQIIRLYGSGGEYLEQKNIQDLESKTKSQQIAQQVSSILQFDQNLDGKVSKKEIEGSVNQNIQNERAFQRRVQEYIKYDLNNDGIINYEEMRAITGETTNRRSEEPDRIASLLALDPNKDGKLTANELESLALSAFSVIDIDKNSLISNEERATIQSQRMMAPLTIRDKLDIPQEFLTSLPKDTEFHAIGIYESDTKNEKGVGVVNVKLERKKTPIVLLLSAYESVDWHLLVDKGVDLKGVIVGGDKTAKVINVPKGIPVYPVKRSLGYGINDNKLDNLAETLSPTGGHLTSWQGDYNAKSYVVSNNFIAQPQKAYYWPKRQKLSVETEIQVVDIKQGQPIIKPVDYNVTMDSDSGVSPKQFTVVDVKNKTKPTLLVLSSASPMVWYINDASSSNIAGVILAGPNLQYLGTSLKNIPVVMWRDHTAGLYNSNEYKKLAEEVRQTFDREITGYSGVNIANKTVHINDGKHFPSQDEIRKQTGIIAIPSSAQTWKVHGEYKYKVPANCQTLHAIAWGAGGAGGSWGSGQNSGGGGAFVAGSFINLKGDTVKVIVGGGGKAGTHLSEKENERIIPTAGKGGFPDGGIGGTGYDATGGGGGGASRLVGSHKPLLIAGGGGGGSGHDGARALGGGSMVYEATATGGSGHDGKGGNTGKLSGYKIGNDPLKVGDAGGESKGGNGGSGGRKGGGGGGGGYGGGGGGAPEFHSPGGGGGGGSLGEDVRPGTIDMTANAKEAHTFFASGSTTRGIPGNAEQAGNSGYGGEPSQNGSDGKVILWCTDQ